MASLAARPSWIILKLEPPDPPHQYEALLEMKTPVHMVHSTRSQLVDLRIVTYRQASITHHLVGHLH
jgi:hypothetical protein